MYHNTEIGKNLEGFQKGRDWKRVFLKTFHRNQNLHQNVFTVKLFKRGHFNVHRKNVKRLIRYPCKEDSNESLRGTYTEFYSRIGGCLPKDRDKFYCSFLFSTVSVQDSLLISLLIFPETYCYKTKFLCDENIFRWQKPLFLNSKTLWSTNLNFNCIYFVKIQMIRLFLASLLRFVLPTCKLFSQIRTTFYVLLDWYQHIHIRSVYWMEAT